MKKEMETRWSLTVKLTILYFAKDEKLTADIFINRKNSLYVHLTYIALMVFVMLCSCQRKNKEVAAPAITIEVWYGDDQRFGDLGLPQKWINILGSVHNKYGLSQLAYSLNDGDTTALTFGPDLHRLASRGDFNVDVRVADCKEGKNTLEFLAIDSGGNRAQKKVRFFVTQDTRWPLPYAIKWSEVANIQDVVQVVDGQWEITTNGLRNKDVYYDRVIAFGDSTWQNYEVSTTVTFHAFTPPAKGPPTYNVSHVAIATRWPGHDVDRFQPHRKWYPLGATAEFRLTAGLDSCRWRIFDGPKPGAPRFYTEQTEAHYRTIQLHKPYRMKHRVQTIGADSTQYSVKLWPDCEPEPGDWDLVGIEQSENMQSGSALLLAHNTKVTFGDVMVIPIAK